MGVPLTQLKDTPSLLSAGDSSAFLPSGASDPVASSFSWNPSGKLTFYCFRNSCHCTHFPHHPLWYRALFFSRNLPFYQWPAHSWVPTSHLEILGESAHRKEASEAQRGLLPRPTVNVCERVSNYYFTAELAPAPTQIHSVQRKTQELFCC